MGKFKVGDRVQHKENDRSGEVFGVHPDTIWVQWDGNNLPTVAMPANLIPVPFAVGDHVIRKGSTRDAYGVGIVEAVKRYNLWVHFEGMTDPMTINVNAVTRCEAKTLKDLPKFDVGDRVKAKPNTGIWYPEAPNGLLLGVDGQAVWGRNDSGKYFTASQDQLEKG
jgi:hypothetical protein